MKSGNRQNNEVEETNGFFHLFSNFSPDFYLHTFYVFLCLFLLKNISQMQKKNNVNLLSLKTLKFLKSLNFCSHFLSLITPLTSGDPHLLQLQVGYLNFFLG